MATSEQKRRQALKQSILEMMSQGKDPKTVRYVHYYAGNFGLDEIDDEMMNFARVKNDLPLPSKKASKSTTSLDEFGNTVIAQEGNIGTPTNGRFSEMFKPASQKAQLNPLAVDQDSLTDAGKLTYNYGTRMYQSGNILAQLEKGISEKGLLDSFGQAAEEKMAGGTITGRFVSPEFQQFDQAQRDFINAVLRRESGAVISPEEFNNARKQYLPVPGDDIKTIEQKRKNRELVTKNFLDATGVNTNQLFNQQNYIDSGIQQPQPTQPTQPQYSVEGAIAWAEDNPKNPKAKQILEAKKKGTLESIVSRNNQPAQVPTQAPQAMGQGQIVEPQVEAKKQGQETFSSIADKVGNFIGIKKFGQGIGSAIYFSTQEGKDLLKKADEGDQPSIDAVNEILKDTPNAKEIVGSAALTALNIASAGAVKGLQGTSTAGKIISGANLGGAYGVAGGLEENKTAGEIAEKGLKGAVLGGTISTAGVGLSKLNKMRKSGQSSNIKKAVGQIVQGEKKDIKPALNTLNQIETKGVKNYSDLKSRIKDNVKVLSGGMKELLSSDETLRKLPELSNSVKVGDTVVKTNYIKQSLNDLAELYQKTNNPTELQRVKNLITQSQKNGLSLVDINDIAKEYGTEFGKKAFSKLGEPLTGVNSVAYENTRKGVKTTLRGLLGDDRSRMIDKNISDHLNTLNLIEKMDKNSNKLLQKINERGLLEKAGSVVGKSVDLLSGHTLRGLAGGLFPSNVGLKTMNSLDMQNKIQKNLKIITKAEGLIDKIGKAGKSTNKALLNTLYNTIRELDE